MHSSEEFRSKQQSLTRDLCVFTLDSQPSREHYSTRGVLGSSFAGYVPLASQNPHPIIVYSMGNYRPILKSFLGKCHSDFKNGIQCKPTVKY